jgi:hypothetical protein
LTVALAVAEPGRVVVGAIAVVVLTACSVPLAAGPVASPQDGASLPTVAAAVLRSWIAADARGQDLLYVSSSTGNGEVYVFSFPGGKLEGELLGYFGPQGECVDKAGDVFVTNENGWNIIEYAHGDALPIAILEEEYSYPVDCSVDPTTGDLAVANYIGTKDGRGDVAIFRHARGKPKQYDSTNIFEAASCTYDGSGNLFVLAINADFKATLEELPRGGHQLTTVSLPKSAKKWLGALRWDGQHVVTHGSEGIYRLSISNGRVKLVGLTPLNPNPGLGYFSILETSSRKGTLVRGKLAGSGSELGTVQIWNYPTGGTPVLTIDDATLLEPAAAAFSPAGE